MRKDITEKLTAVFTGKKILIWGFGREGKSSLTLIRRLLPEMPVAVADSGEPDLTGFDNVTFIKADKDNANIPFCDYDIIMKSPGIAVDRDIVPVERLSSQTQLFMELFRKQMIGVTGTKGKSTTSSMLYHIISSQFEDTIFCGNIGIPCFDILDRITSETKIVFEMSCHQLEFATCSPHISVILNLHQDHLDHYGTYEKYIEAKTHIFTGQDEDDFCLLNVLDTETYKAYPSGDGHKIYVSQDSDAAADIRVNGRTITTPGSSVTIGEHDTALVGGHNLYNIGVAYYICSDLLGIGNAEFLGALASFAPLPHRLQKVAEIDGVTYYDDSISTICESAINAIKALKNIGTIILGGMDRGIDYTDLLDCLFSVKIDNLVLIGQTTPRMKALIEERSAQTGIMQNIHCAADMADAVAFAKANTAKGKICLLSPAAASYDMFKNFEVRGDAFAACVKGE